MSDGGEERDFLASQERLLQMVERLVENQAQFEADVNHRFDKLQNLIVGNGDDDRAILPRVRKIEHVQASQQKQLDQHGVEIRSNTDFKNIWKNRLIGMGMLLPILLALLIVLAAYLAGIVLAP